MQRAVDTDLADKELAEVFEKLSSHGAVTHSYYEINGAGLNINDNPWIGEEMRPIVCDMLTQVRQSGVVYDTVVGIPTRGERWAKEFVNLASTQGNANLYKLNKVCTATFSIIDGQGVAPGSKMVLIDDTIYQGDTSSSAAEVLTKAGYEIVCLAFPVAIGRSGCNFWKKKGIPVLSTYDETFLETYKKGAE